MNNPSIPAPGAACADLPTRDATTHHQPARRPRPAVSGDAAKIARAPAPDRGAKLKFADDQGFHAEVKRRVQAYFERAALSQRDSPRMYAKTAVLLLWFAASYGLLVFVATSWWLGALLSLSLALAMAGIGFCVQHDANHGAYSNRGAVNRLMGMTLDMLGASSYLWRFKHNVSHHTYTNLAGADDDIDFRPFARLSPMQPRYGAHRFQQFYLWALYWFLFPKWNFIDDFKGLIQARIAGRRIPRPHGLQLFELIAGKIFFCGWAFVLPALFHPFRTVLIFYATTSLVLGTTLAVVFMLAHCVEEADFPEPPAGSDHLASTWAVHQIQTTVDFARGNRLLTWYVGGLNFQIEHHLFPRVCHVHYPRVAEIVQATCLEFGVRYAAHETFLGAVASHWRWLRRMGLPTSVTAAAAAPAAPSAVPAEPSGQVAISW
jgi:linoleoyl-CoA desaturase